VPAFVAAAEYDTIFPPRPVEASAAKAVQNGANVQFKHYEGEGHVTIASVALEDAFEWLLAQRVDPQPMERRD
jgi:dienelactone hydrolase